MSGVFVIQPEDRNRDPSTWADHRHFAFSFDEPTYNEVFWGSTIDVAAYPQLQRMNDLYGEADYHSDDLVALAAELKKVIPHFPPRSAARKTLRVFLDVCQKAIKSQQVVRWWGD